MEKGIEPKRIELTLKFYSYDINQKENMQKLLLDIVENVVMKRRVYIESAFEKPIYSPIIFGIDEFHICGGEEPEFSTISMNPGKNIRDYMEMMQKKYGEHAPTRCEMMAKWHEGKCLANCVNKDKIFGKLGY